MISEDLTLTQQNLLVNRTNIPENVLFTESLAPGVNAWSYADINLEQLSISATMPQEPSKMIRVPTPLVDAVRELSRLHRAGRTLAVLEGVQRLVAAIDSEADVDIDSVTKTISKLTSRLDRLESERASEETTVDIAPLMLSISELTSRLVRVEGDVEAIALTLQDLNVRVSDLEGVGDIGYTTSRLSSLEALDDIDSDIDLTAEPLASADIATDIESIAEPRDRSDISTDSETTAEVEEQADIDADSGASSESKSLPQPVAPLTQSALAKRLGCSDKAVEKQRKHGKESFATWSGAHDPDGIAWTWQGRGGRGQPLQFVPAYLKSNRTNSYD